MKKPKITIITGHYGSGKTNLAINLAVEAAEKGEKVVVADMDIVNPYFRSSDYFKLLSERGIELIAPGFAGSTLDTPSIPAAIYSIFNGDRRVFIDVGGDDAGATALGVYSKEIIENGYEMIYVINKSRILAGTPENALELLREIEAASRLKATAIVNNTHMGVETNEQIVRDSFGFARATAEKAGLPLLYSTSPDFAFAKETKVVERFVRFPWEGEDF